MASINRLPVLKLFGMVISQTPKRDNNDCAQNASSSSSSSDAETGSGAEVFGTGAEPTSPENLRNTVLSCPRCNSMDTKFCYFNNYNVNQPRHFCQTCKRYWTVGGSLRDVPFGRRLRTA